jgi:hypothetical protein
MSVPSSYTLYVDPDDDSCSQPIIVGVEQLGFSKGPFVLVKVEWDDGNILVRVDRGCDFDGNLRIESNV